MKVYVVTMYRFGDRERHSYVHGVYDNSYDAIKRAREEEEYRGGKYSPEVIEWEVGTPTSSEKDDAKWHKLIKVRKQDEQ